MAPKSSPKKSKQEGEEEDLGNGYTSKNAYATLLTRPSYLAGAILLADTLHKHSPDTPLIIVYTPDTLPEACEKALETESHLSMCILVSVDHLRIPSQPPKKEGQQEEEEHGMVAERFIDTWTKLRIFELHNMGFEKICFLDADMMIFGNPTPWLFRDGDGEVKDGELLATHTCVCNLDGDAWASKEWTTENCAYTGVKGSEEVPEVEGEEGSTKSIFNSGCFVFRATEEMEDLVLGTFKKTEPAVLRRMKFPDQDFLSGVFHGRWRSLHWSTNALKTWRYWHENMWRDGDVKVLHYIVDKPWAKRIGEDGKAGYKGLDGETHSWWWKEYEVWKESRLRDGGEEGRQVVEVVGRYVAGGEGEESEELKAIGGGAQEYAKKWEGKGKMDGESQLNDPLEVKGEGGQDSHGPNLRKPMLGERGHGPVVRGRGIGGGKGASYMADG